MDNLERMKMKKRDSIQDKRDKVMKDMNTSQVYLYHNDGTKAGSFSNNGFFAGF